MKNLSKEEKECTKPHCDCLAQAEKKAGGPVKNYECLAGSFDRISFKQLFKESSLFKSKEEVRTAEEMFHASAKKQWLESPGFTPKMGSLGQVPHVCIPAIVELMEEYAAQFKSQSEGVGWISVENKFIDEEIAYLKSCNSANRFGEIENQFAAGMICAYERLIREREYFTRKVSVGEEKKD